MPEGLPVYPQPENAPCLADRDPLDMDSLTHSYQMIKHDKSEITLLRNLTLRLLMSYMYGAPILDVSRSHTTTQHSR